MKHHTAQEALDYEFEQYQKSRANYLEVFKQRQANSLKKFIKKQQEEIKRVRERKNRILRTVISKLRVGGLYVASTLQGRALIEITGFDHDSVHYFILAKEDDAGVFPVFLYYNQKLDAAKYKPVKQEDLPIYMGWFKVNPRFDILLKGE